MKNPILESIESYIGKYCYYIYKSTPEWYTTSHYGGLEYKGYIIEPVLISSMMIIYDNL